MLESSILGEKNPRLHRAASRHVISWVKITFRQTRIEVPYQEGTHKQGIKTQST